MDVIALHGGRPLRGAVNAAGSKNAALPIMAASILADEPVALGRVPDVTDVNTLALVLGYVGVETKRHADCRVHLQTVDLSQVTARPELVSRMRASFCVLGPLLARRKKAIVALPGGCQIGPRPIDLHLQGLAALGAKIRIQDNFVFAEAKALHGVEMNLSGLHGPTVTGTANVLMAAVLARGETIIHGAAREPEVVDLGEFLISIGARIDGLGTSTLRIRGVDQLGGGSYNIIPDRMETGTLLLAGAITGGDVTVRNCRPDHLEAALAVLDDAGVMIDTGPDWIRAALSDRPQPFHFTALPYPGVPTDLQPQFMALAAIADGQSTITDHVFPHRFNHISELHRFGARIHRRGPTATIDGVNLLHSPTVSVGRNDPAVVASDLRAAAGLMLAALAAPGRTVIREISHLHRGYQHLDEKLRQLGANIETYQTEWYNSDSAVRGQIFWPRVSNRVADEVSA
jgi:UDP-N-acetylglucosamine 1-carboxyvinyltransferase